MEKYNLIQTSSILWIFFKQAKMVSDPFPNQVQREIKTETLHQQLTPLALFSAKLFPFGTRSSEDSSSGFTFIL